MITQGGTEASHITDLLFQIIIVSFCNVVFFRHENHWSFEMCNFVKVNKEGEKENEKKKQDDYFRRTIQRDAAAIARRKPTCHFCNLVVLSQDDFSIRHPNNMEESEKAPID